MILEHPPQGQVRKKLASHTRPASADSDATAVIQFEWIVSGLTAVCFWTAPRRLIAALEGPVGLRVNGETPHWPD